MQPSLGRRMQKVNYQVDLIDEIWEDRPVLSEEPAFNLDVKYAGETVASKLARIREEMKEAGTNVHVVSTIDDICWTLNIRGNDMRLLPTGIILWNHHNGQFRAVYR